MAPPKVASFFRNWNETSFHVLGTWLIFRSFKHLLYLLTHQWHELRWCARLNLIFCQSKILFVTQTELLNIFHVEKMFKLNQNIRGFFWKSQECILNILETPSYPSFKRKIWMKDNYFIKLNHLWYFINPECTLFWLLTKKSKN